MTKLRTLINEKFLDNQERPKIPTSVKKQFVEAVGNFHHYGESIYRDTDYKKMCSELNEIIQIAEQLTLQESEHWFDNITVSRHMKQLSEAYKVFQKTANEMSGLQQRMEAAYDDMGSVLGKYYKVGESLNDDIEVEGDYKKKVTEAGRYNKPKQNRGSLSYYKKIASDPDQGPLQAAMEYVAEYGDTDAKTLSQELGIDLASAKRIIIKLEASN